MKWPPPARLAADDERTDAAISKNRELRRRLATAIADLDQFLVDVRDELGRRRGDGGDTP